MKQKAAKRLIVVLGMHRSGTSAVTRGLQVMGVQLGDRLMPQVEGDNPKGFWEDLDLYALNIELLKFLGSEWHHLAPIEPGDVEALRKNGYFLRAAELLRQKVGHAAIFGFKDPRVAMLLPFWKEVFSHCQLDVRYVLVLRHPLSVVKSLSKRNGFDAEKSHLLWLGHVTMSLAGTTGDKRVLVDYDHLIQSPERQLNRIAKHLGLKIDQGELQYYKTAFLDLGLRHTIYDLRDLLLDDACPPLVSEIYVALLDVASEKQRNANLVLRNKTARWVREFDRFKSALVLVDKLCTQKEAVNQVVAECEAQIAALNHAVSERDRQAASLNQGVAEREAQIASLNQGVAERDGQISTLSARLSSAQHETQQHERRVEQLQTALTERDREIVARNQAVAQRDGQIVNLKQTVAERDRQIATLIASRSWRLTKPLRFVGRLIRGELGMAFAPFRRTLRRLATARNLCRAVPRAVSFYGGSLQLAIRRVLGVLMREGVSGVTRRANVLMHGAGSGPDLGLMPSVSESGQDISVRSGLRVEAPGNRSDGHQQISDAAIDAEVTAIRNSGLFDEPYYRSMYADLQPAPLDVIRHYCGYGWREGRNPSDDFDTQFYLATYSDIRNSGMNPFYHYVIAGASELRHALPDLATRYENDICFGAVDTDIKLIAFYAFPDWAKVRTRKPMFKGHKQPLLPHEELGFYDPLDWRVLRRQAQMAKRHGIYGFCFKLSTDAHGRGSTQLVENLLNHDNIDFLFCVRAALSSGETLEPLVALLVRAVSDSRYMRIVNRPVVLVAMPGDKRNWTNLLSHLRTRLAEQGVGNPFLIGQWEPARDEIWGTSVANLCDAALDLPDAPVPDETGDFMPLDKEGIDVVPYRVVVSHGVARARKARGYSYPLYHAVSLARDNTARGQERPVVYTRFNLSDYRRWLDKAIAEARDAHSEDRRLVFVNGWNAWNESLFLEPDRQGGFNRLNETSRALSSITSGMAMPKVSVIVPNYNHEIFLRRRLDSIYKQTYKNFEVILLDDGSSDQSQALMDQYAAAYPDITRTSYNNENSGNPFRQWAKGIKAARGDLVWIAESDDYCDERFLEVLVRRFDDEAVLLAYSKSAFVDRNEVPIRDDFQSYLSDLECADKWNESYVETAHNEVRTALGIKNTIPNASGVLFKRPIDMPLLEDESWLSMAVAGDWVFYLHVIRGGKIAYDKGAANFFRRYQGSTAEVTYKKSIFYREVGIASRTVAALYDVPLAILEQCRRGYRTVYEREVGRSDEEFSLWYDYESILEAHENRSPTVMVSTMGFFPGGAEIFPIRLANEFKRQGLSVLLLNAGLNPREDGIRRMLRNDVPVIETSNVEDVKTIIHEFGVEILNTHQWHIQKYPLRCPDVFDELRTHVASLHGMIEHGDVFGVTPEQLRVADKNVETWVYTADKNLKPFSDAGLVDESSSRFVKIPTGMQPPEILPVPRAEMSIPEDAFVFCCVSRAIPEKGWAETVSVVGRARALSGRDIRLILVGNGPVYDDYCRVGVPDFVYLAGFSDNSVGYYAAADMGIMLTKFKSESSPLTVVDCLFAGKPYIASDVGDIRNMLTTVEGVAGEVIGLEDWEIPIERAAEVIAAFATDKRKYLEAVALVQDVIHRYRIDVVASEYIRLFNGSGRGEMRFGHSRGCGTYGHAAGKAHRVPA